VGEVRVEFSFEGGEFEAVLFPRFFEIVFVEGAEPYFADHHFSFPLADLHHHVFGKQQADSVVVVNPKMDTDGVPVSLKVDEDRASGLSRLGDNAVNDHLILDFNNISLATEKALSVHRFGVSIDLNSTLIIRVIVFYLTIFLPVSGTIEFHHCQTDACKLVVRCGFQVFFLNPVLPDFDGSFFLVDGWRVEVEVSEEALVLFAVDVVGGGDDEVVVDEEGSPVQGDASVRVGVFEQSNTVVRMCENIWIIVRVAANLFMKQI
jgi:hypothetical protein